MRWGRLAQLLSAALLSGLIASVAWTAFAVQAIAPRTTFSDLRNLIADPTSTRSGIGHEIESNRRVNVLLLAHGGAGGDDPDFTDTILFLSVRPATHHAVVISLPRFLWVDIPAPQQGFLQGKLYSAYALGASSDSSFLNARWRSPAGQGDLAAATVSGVIDQPIDAWIAIDVRAFQVLIDAMGGITVDVPQVLDDPHFPMGVDDRTIHIHFDPGTQQLDGRRALEYVRSRLSTSEADRARRQEAVLFAMLGRLKSAGVEPSAVPALGALKDGVRTDLTLPDANAFARLLNGVSRRDVTAIVLEGSPLLTSRTIGNGQEILVPSSGSFAELRAYFAARLP